MHLSKILLTFRGLSFQPLKVGQLLSSHVIPSVIGTHLSSAPVITTARQLTTSVVVYRRPGIVYPHGVSFDWAYKRIFDPDQYTVDAVCKVRTGGRGPDGRIQLKHRTTGLNRPWFMIDYNHSRHLPTGEIWEELVLRVHKNWWHHPYIALVARGDVKRWIVATINMKPGDIIRAHCEIPTVPINAKEGDAHPVGALPVGATVCLVELNPGEGAQRFLTAGTSGTIVRRGRLVGESTDTPDRPPTNAPVLDDESVVIVRDNGTRRLLRLRPECMVVVGQVSNHENNKMKFSKFGEKKWRGIKQRSGLWQRKTGRFGRKVRPLGPPIDCTQPFVTSGIFTIKVSRPGVPQMTQQRESRLHVEMTNQENQKIAPKPEAYNAEPHNLPTFNWCSWSSVR